ncbi:MULTISPECIES: ATP-binding protein [Streptomyces]|uniref:LuxR family transcriptional regulator n=2 Tax=Streptomyces TaxID=1883 RepID=A0A2U9PA72_STRAS|nr:LuxR C-terminal-related transcriptional regulator [Streptomyces actuosus]AWT46689.1 LuxR family transcriptional regulator [Streptomyces actuosus]MBM4823421.1 LuxR family transcriptional regulator [Streptomyces actuosus]
MSRSRTCDMCGATLTVRPHGGRPARYCSGACRQRALRRRAASGVTPAVATAGGNTLPSALDSFVGRQSELSALRTLFRSSRLLTLTGAGGVGKTRLALEFAKALPRRFARVDLVELASVQDGAPATQSVAAALGVGERAGRTGVDVLVRAIGDTSRVLILDNCEHLAEPCARLAANLLGRCPRLRILATSRETLRVPGETVFRLGELSLPPAHAGDDATALMRSDAVRLFFDRAASNSPGFALHPGNGHLVAEICRRLDGLALAVELAARHVRVLALSDILAGLDDQFRQLDLLTGGSRTGPARHSGFAAAVDWSHRLLDPAEQAVFRRLSVLVGGFDATAAQAVCSGDGIGRRQVFRILCALEAKSLVVRLPGETAPTRFRQLSAIRAFALDRLRASGELHATLSRALAWLTELAEGGRGEVFADQAGSPLAADRDTLVSVLACGAGHGDAVPARLTLELARVHYQQEQPSAARALLGGLLGGAGGRALGGQVPALAARVACQQADLDEALRLGEQAVRSERMRGDAAGLANALDARAAARLCRGEFAEAVADLRECLEAVASSGSPQDIAWCTQHLAWALLQSGGEVEADELMRRCLPVLRRQAPWPRLAAALHTAGAIRLALGRLRSAETFFSEVLRIAPGASFHALYPVEGLALVAAESGDMQRALRLYEASVQARRHLDTEPEAPWRHRMEQAAARARTRLPAAAREAAVAGARGLRGERLVAYALGAGSDEDRPRRDAHATDERLRLTARESTVAGLVAEGLTNRQIADRLGLSVHTVATHLDRIRDKLGLRSRTQIALWAAAGTGGGCTARR